jgi:predicted signal transduction protein with EAL and GGDEF domain
LAARTATIAAGRAGHVVGTAIGIALSPQDGATAEEILRKADVALYRAKPERVSSRRFFEPDNQLRERELLEAALHRAIADDAIGLRFKPAVNGRTGKVTAFEALPQWIHPDFGEVAADRFMPIAEDTGLGPALTEQLLRKACAVRRHSPRWSNWAARNRRVFVMAHLWTLRRQWRS